MFRLVCLLNALLVLPFAVSVILAPDFTFGNFGIDLGPEAGGVAQGYGAAALGWGLVTALLSGATDRAVVQPILIASLAFNLVEVVIQVTVALSGIASAMIWVTVISHAVLVCLTLLALWRFPSPRSDNSVA